VEADAIALDEAANRRVSPLDNGLKDYVANHKGSCDQHDEQYDRLRLWHN
jgi:hypothetical protein